MFYEWSITFRDVLAALLEQMDAASGAVLVVVYGMALLPSMFGYLVGVVGHASLGIVAPISFQQETIILAGRTGRDVPERLNIIMVGGLLAVVLGLFGALQATVGFIGDAVFYGMLAGIGIYLARAGLELGRENIKIGIGTLVVAILIMFLTNDLLYAIAGSLVAGLIMGRFIKYESPVDSAVKQGIDFSGLQKLHFAWPKLSILKRPHVIRGILAVLTLQIGGNITYGYVTAGMGDKPFNVDHLTIVSGAADFTSALFGGGPVEAIISPTGAAPNPWISGILLMAFAAILLKTGVFVRIAKYLPLAALCGFLFVLGTFGAFVPNVQDAMAAGPAPAAAALVITGLVDPFSGMVAGVFVKYLLMLGGG